MLYMYSDLVYLVSMGILHVLYACEDKKKKKDLEGTTPVKTLNIS
jgi:hypothetical protein